MHIPDIERMNRYIQSIRIMYANSVYFDAEKLIK